MVVAPKRKARVRKSTRMVAVGMHQRDGRNPRLEVNLEEQGGLSVEGEIEVVF